MLPTKDREDKRKNLRVAVLSTNASELLKQHELLARSAGIEMTPHFIKKVAQWMLLFRSKKCS